MKRTIAAITITIATAIYIGQALAACPPGTRYTCVQGYNGKVICSCS